jgi:riboflavin biosynthesis pyrimidine reductase
MRFSQLWPMPREAEIEQFVAELEFAQRASSERPFTVVNFVSSVDGRVTVNGRSGRLGDDGDKALFGALRREVDAVLVGTGTLEAEHYGRILRDPASRQRRQERGLRPEPLACTLTRRGVVPLDIPLFAEPEAKVVVFTCDEVNLSGVRAQVDIVRMAPAELNFAAALRHLRVEYDVRALLCEGGPRVFGALAREGVADQLFLTLSRMLVGGGNAPQITRGPELSEPIAISLDAVLERNGTLFLRYAIAN